MCKLVTEYSSLFALYDLADRDRLLESSHVSVRRGNKLVILLHLNFGE